jgi:Flp pilus assembly protein TadD
VQKQSRRWLTIAILSIASLGFLGATMLPLIMGILNQQQIAAPNSTSSPTIATNAAEILLKEEEGYEIVLKRNPDDKNVLLGLIDTRQKLIQAGVRQPKDVIEPLKKMVKLEPSDVRFPPLLAWAQRQSGDLNGAAQTNRDILTQQPTNPKALQGYVEWLVISKKQAEALDVLQKAIATAKQMNQQQAGSADLPGIELILGDVYLSQQQSAEAMALYSRLQKENPNDFRPVLAEGIVLSDQGKKAEALTRLNTANSMAPVEVKEKIQGIIAKTQAGVPLTSTGSPAPSPTSGSVFSPTTSPIPQGTP